MQVWSGIGCFSTHTSPGWYTCTDDLESREFSFHMVTYGEYVCVAWIFQMLVPTVIIFSYTMCIC